MHKLGIFIQVTRLSVRRNYNLPIRNSAYNNNPYNKTIFVFLFFFQNCMYMYMKLSWMKVVPHYFWLVNPKSQVTLPVQQVNNHCLRLNLSLGLNKNQLSSVLSKHWLYSVILFKLHESCRKTRIPGCIP